MTPIGKIELKFYATLDREPLIAGMYLCVYNGDGEILVLEYRNIDGVWDWRDRNGSEQPRPFAWAWLYRDAMLDILLA